MNKRNLILFLVFLLLMVGVGLGTYYFSFKGGYSLGYEEGKVSGYEEGKRVGLAAAKVEAGEIVSGPLDEMPSANPYEGVVNPFDRTYINPFK